MNGPAQELVAQLLFWLIGDTMTIKMQALGKKVAHYWKWVPWTQPVLTSDNSYGTITVSSKYDSATSGYRASDGVKTGAFDEYKFWCSQFRTPYGWLKWVLPQKIKITQIKFYNIPSDMAIYTKNAQFFADEAKTIPLGNAFVGVASNWGLTTIAVDSVETDVIYFYASSSSASRGYVGIGEMEITAVIAQESTIADYDFVTYTYDFFGIAKEKRNYFKWEAWTQPIFSDSNIASDGSVISSNSIRPDSNDYGAMDGIKSGSGERHTWKSDNTNNCYWKVVFPYEIKITGLTHYNARNKDNLYRNVQGRFYADEAMSTPIGDAISTPVTSWYQTPIANIPSEGIITDTIYFRKTGGDPVSGIGELEIVATILVEGTAEDYDFYESTYMPLQFAERIKDYYKWVAWTQPVFSDYTASDGSIISAEHYNTAYPGYPYGAMDGVKSGPADGTSDINIFSASGTSGVTTGWWKVKFPYKIKITKLVHYNRPHATYSNITGRYFADEAMTIPIGNSFTSNTSWGATTVFDNSASPIITDTIFFNKTAGHYSSGIGELEITATKLVTGSAEDYDFYEY